MDFNNTLETFHYDTEKIMSYNDEAQKIPLEIRQPMINTASELFFLNIYTIQYINISEVWRKG